MSVISRFGSKLKRTYRHKIVHPILMVVFCSLIFGVGVFAGQGKIRFGRDALFHKTVNSGLPTNLDYAGVEQVYDSIRENYDGKLEADKLLDGIKAGLAKSTGDAYTEYFNPKAAQEFKDELSGTFIGIGAELSKDTTTTNTIVVVAPITGFPAEKAGLKPKDVIAEIDGKSAYDISVSEAVSKIRGEKGTTVKLKVVRDGKEQIELSIVRDEIKIPSVNTKTLDNNIGYIQITRFSDDTVALVQEAATKFKADNVKGIVLDMRSDPGGLLDAAVGVSSLFMDNKTVLTERRDGQVVRTYSTKGVATLKGVKTVVLINGGSASASEITAGALRDNSVATLIGEKSFGKGSVQNLVRFGDDSMLKVTIARWYTPAGKNIDKEGITPDKEVKISDEEAKAGKDTQLEAALTEINK